MAHSPISIVDIQNRIIAYFAKRYHWPETDFDQDTNVKAAFNFSEAGWRDLATSVFNHFDWMIAYFHPISQPEMGDVKTIGEITYLIASKRKATPKKVKMTAIVIDESLALPRASQVDFQKTADATAPRPTPAKKVGAKKAAKKKTVKKKSSAKKPPAKKKATETPSARKTPAKKKISKTVKKKIAKSRR